MSRIAPSLRGRVSRRNVALSPHVWFAVWGCFGLLAAATAVIALALPGMDAGRILPLSAALAVIAVTLTRLRPPEPASTAAHVLLLVVTASCAATLVAFGPHASGASISMVFLAPLAAIWLDRRREVTAHLLIATATLVAVALAARVDTATVFAIAAMLPALWVLCACCVLVLESAETQGRVLERQVGLDTLTGLGNRRTLDDQLGNELMRHAASRRQLSVLALNLNGFARVNDRLGHATGDELLESVAATLTKGARRHDIVIRLGGDDFCLLLPHTGRAAAIELAVALRERLAQIASYGSGMTAGIGIATYPADGADAASLLGAADARLREDKARTDDIARSPVSLAAELASRVDTGAPRSAPRPSAAPPRTPFDDRITRADLAMMRGVWALTGGVTLVYSALGSLLIAVAPSLATPLLPYVLGASAVVGMFILITPPPAAGTVGSHASLVAIALMPVLALVACQPGGSVALGTALFTGPLIVVRSRDRGTVALHLVIAQAMLLAPIPFGLVDGITTVGILLLGLVMWVLATSWVLVFEAIESQGSELAHLTRTDALTGSGNRLLLHERLEAGLASHAETHRSLTIMALEVCGWADTRAASGHAAGDELLVTAASRLRAAAGPGATVCRIGGARFCLVLPDTSGLDADAAAAALRRAVASLESSRTPVWAELGIAIFPEDGRDLTTLLDHADADVLRASRGLSVVPLAS